LDASTLRWILIVIGVVVVGSIFLFGNPSKKKAPKASPRRAKTRSDGSATRREPTLDSAQPGAADDLFADVEEGGQGELAIDDEPAPEAVAEPPKRRAPAGPPPDRIVTLFLLARDNHVISGAELLQATVSTGLEFGDMNIFHRMADGEEKPVFSLANAAKPGHFERDEWNTFETSGVVLFMTLPGPMHALDAWDAMLAAARRIGDILFADLLDDQRNPFTRQREAQIREEMREYDRQKNPVG
jgi:cell division protein ZipA